MGDSMKLASVVPVLLFYNKAYNKCCTFFNWLIFDCTWSSLTACGLPLLGVLLIAVASFMVEHGLHGLGSCSSRGLELRLSSCGCMGLVAPEHVKSSWTRDQIRVPCFGRQILNHWITREVHMFFLNMNREHGLVHFITHQATHLEILPFLHICYILQ